MTNPNDLKPLYHRPTPGCSQPTREQLIAAAPPEHRSQLMHKHISELFNEKYMTNSLLRHAVDAGIQQNLSEVDSLKNLVVLLLNEKEELLNEKIKQLMESKTPNIVGLGYQPKSGIHPDTLTKPKPPKSQ